MFQFSMDMEILLSAKGCAADANCPLDRPVCGAGLLFDASGSGSGGGKLIEKLLLENSRRQWH